MGYPITGYPKGRAMRVKLARWGNSLAVRIPKDLAETAGFVEGQELEAEASARGVALQRPLPKYRLEDMIEEMRRLGPDMEPGDLVDWGPDRGSEILPEDDYTRLGEAALRPKAD